MLRPERSGGGYRLYSEADEHRVRLMRAHLSRGLSAAEAARATLREPCPAAPGPSGAGQALAEALEDFDEASAQDLFDRLLTEFTPEAVLRDVLLPYLHELGARWRRGEVTVAQEHFASHVVRARLAALGRGWGRGRGRARSSPARPGNCTTSRCWRSASCCSETAGACTSSAAPPPCPT